MLCVWQLRAMVWFLVGGLFTPGMLHAAPKPCRELKSEIETKILANGVRSFDLTIVPFGQAGNKRVVGSCEGGTRQITYVNHGPTAGGVVAASGECVGAKVAVSRDFSLGYESFILTAVKEGRRLVLPLARADFVGFACRKNPRGEAHIVFQAYCGGTGCQDQSNFGLILVSSLELLLLPEDGNNTQAAQIFGTDVDVIGEGMVGRSRR